MRDMDGGQLHRLGKRLIELSRQVTGEPGDLTLTPGEAAVLEDVITHPDSSVSEIGQRTGFVQSHVSTSVARLKKRGLITTASDLADGRRTRVRISGTAMNAITRRAVRRIDDTLGRSVADPIRAERVTVLLDELARLLLR
ncbi:MAG: MarR family winged helix-turn-helix transcriptional regulator [Sciscionella sp.]